MPKTLASNNLWAPPSTESAVGADQQLLERLGWRGQTIGEWSAVVDASLEQVAQLIVESGWTI